MKETNWEELIESSYQTHVFNCKTEEIANEFLKILHDLGYSWNSNKSLLLNKNWSDHQEETCYRIYHPSKSCTYGYVRYFNNKGYRIMDVDEILGVMRKPFKLNRK